MIENDAKSTTDVLSWGIGTQGQRYSPLKQINTATVKQAGAGLVLLLRR
jgi:alcohol dehydrogenase (cytochrome c)